MKEYPHHYPASASAGPSGSVRVTAPGLDPIESAPPIEFGGPGDRWSPEALLIASIADCFILTFRAVARASRLEWEHLECDAEGTLERVDRVTRFTAYRVVARLTLPAGGDAERAKKLLEKAEHGCMITSSLNGAITLETEVVTGTTAAA